MKLSLDDIAADERAQPRAAMDHEVIDDYSEAFRRGEHFPPLVVFYDQKKYWLADGFHRYHAASLVGVDRLDCNVQTGGLREAILYSCGANAAHGLRRTNADRRNSVVKLLNDAEWGDWSDHEIARRCGVSNHLVAKVRKENKKIVDTGKTPGMRRTFVHPKTGAATTMTFATRESVPSDSGAVASALRDIVRLLDTLPSPTQAVESLPQGEDVVDPAVVAQCAAWLREFATVLRASLASGISSSELEYNFKLVVDAAAAGERCPQSSPHGPLSHKALALLCSRGRVKVEIFARNFRRATILTGDHAGMATSGPPETSWKPYRVIDANSAAVAP